MKLIYCIHSVCNPGGMERVMLNKITYLVTRLHWEILIVTTNQQGKEPFYSLPEGVRMVDLGINYAADGTENPIRKIVNFLRKRSRHRQALTELLMKERADIVVSLYPSESSFIPSIKDGSRKVLELHFNKFFRLQYNRKGLIGWLDRVRTRQDEQLVRRFDKFVVLTEEDRGYWGDLPNIVVIPNAALMLGEKATDVTAPRVIAVGRLDYQKSFDRLIEAWEKVQQYPSYKGWRLDIFGQGEWKERLQRMIDEKGLQHSVVLNAPTSGIGEEYAKSSLLVMSSHYEGLPMVMIEGMAVGLPVVSFDYPCGPKDVIRPGINGILVKDGDIQGLAEGMMKVMGDEAMRKRMSAEARKMTETFSEEKVMKQWVELFLSLVKK